MKKVLVLCTGNSCRSVMAEALINHLGAGHYTAVSAGSFPAGYVHPGSLETLARHQVPVDKPRSKSWDEFSAHHFDLVLAVCDEAAKETCPAFPGRFERKHWSIPDPAKAEGSEAEVQRAFDDAFNLLKDRIEAELL
ncbi:arsenate reductase ArsC [Congregibacter litoralis]|uniref:Protein-tyrosine-phosphatase n=1 Tax=Congregibacter litoralis KT71 TaxID=314285 RepID=A4A481_9GAMM|nr:arsenate reductase ArsC [Congregibacter litoralis]EAQ99504.1 Protein-tyrosine-phosphatase [Congregibacter litoralis KT71]